MGHPQGHPGGHGLLPLLALMLSLIWSALAAPGGLIATLSTQCPSGNGVFTVLSQGSNSTWSIQATGERGRRNHRGCTQQPSARKSRTHMLCALGLPASPPGLATSIDSFRAAAVGRRLTREGSCPCKPGPWYCSIALLHGSRVLALEPALLSPHPAMPSALLPSSPPSAGCPQYKPSPKGSTQNTTCQGKEYVLPAVPKLRLLKDPVWVSLTFKNGTKNPKV